MGKNQQFATAALNQLKMGNFLFRVLIFFELPIDKIKFFELEKQFIELFIEISSEKTEDFFDSIEDAIKYHDMEFLN